MGTCPEIRKKDTAQLSFFALSCQFFFFFEHSFKHLCAKTSEERYQV
jgi:hypothetical protein